MPHCTVQTSGWVGINVVGIICPLVGIGLADLPKNLFLDNLYFIKEKSKVI
jgi:hypothetical protein